MPYMHGPFVPGISLLKAGTAVRALPRRLGVGVQRLVMVGLITFIVCQMIRLGARELVLHGIIHLILKLGLKLGSSLDRCRRPHAHAHLASAKRGTRSERRPEAALRGMLRISAQRRVMARLVSMIISCMVRLERRVHAVLRLSHGGRTKAARSGVHSIRREAASDVPVGALRRVLRIAAPRLVMARLVPAIASRMESLRVLLLAVAHGLVLLAVE